MIRRLIILLLIVGNLYAVGASHKRVNLDGIENTIFWWFPYVFVLFTIGYFTWKLLTNKKEDKEDSTS